MRAERAVRPDTIGTTSNHPFWSVDRQEYVQAGQLGIGERLQTYSGDTKRVHSKLARPSPQAVYNLEVFAEHVYYVGKDGVLVHNSYGLDPKYEKYVDTYMSVTNRATFSDSDLIAAIAAKHGTRLNADDLRRLRGHVRSSLDGTILRTPIHGHTHSSVDFGDWVLPTNGQRTVTFDVSQ